MPPDNVHSFLNIISPIALDEMDEIAFMNRTDTKFLLHVSRLPEILAAAAKHYRILEINGVRAFEYQTRYMDTHDLFFLNEHLRGKSNRQKVRYRTYCNTNTHFLEIKKKNNKSYTSKWRMKLSSNENIYETKQSGFLSKHLTILPSDLLVVLQNSFTRITLAGNAPPERVTIDTGLKFNVGDLQYHLKHICIVELKKNGFSVNTPFYKILRKAGALQTGFSKYAMGMYFTNQCKKSNTLKPKAHLLAKMDKELFSTP